VIGVFLKTILLKRFGQLPKVRKIITGGMSADENVGVDHYRRERSRQLRQLEIQNQIAAPLEKVDSPPKGITRSGSSPNLYDVAREQEKAPKVPPIVKARPSASFSLPRVQSSTSIKPQSRAADDPESPPVPLRDPAIDKDPAFAKHVE
jgi:hypothetical protein